MTLDTIDVVEPADSSRNGSLETEVAALREEVAQLRAQVERVLRLVE